MDLNALKGLLGVSDQEKREAMNYGLLSSGLGILANNTNRRNGLPAISQGAMMGLQSYQDQIKQAKTNKLQDFQMQQLIAKLEEEQKQKALFSEYVAKLPPEQQAQVTAAKAMGIPMTSVWERQNPLPKQHVVDGNLVEISGAGPAKTLFTAPDKPVKPTSDIQNYNFALEQGYKGTLTDWQKEIKRAGAQNTTIVTPKDIIKSETDIRKEFEGLEPVKNYRMAYPAFAAVKDAASRNNPQADINLVYGLAKLYDPTSVVREGEYNTIANSQTIPERLKGIAQNLAGGGKLTAETKASLLAEANGRIKTFEDQYSGVRRQYKDIAGRQSLDPRNIFTPIGQFDANGFRSIPDAAKNDLKMRINQPNAKAQFDAVFGEGAADFVLGGK